ncbi:cytidylate kinase [Porphyromonas circumdentaria]|uniref:Cytidylate kinase n=2 Tax=Porphyromonas circumdentaria TaxID=29524 RepID=A0A1T4P778_9PORP|nr:cytidylate kinase [Porphyromonas circumdentaria]SJZ86758.1 cytidylate kinase [Porphyromonas circumdentaria]
MMQNKIIIAIDGHSSCGKSTMAKDLAKALNYTYIDTGAMYRAVTLFSLRAGLWKGEVLDTDVLRQQLPSLTISFERMPNGELHTFLNGEDVEKEIRTMAVSEHVSPVSTLGFVREAMVAQQQAMGVKKGIVMDGRDIGTTVFPQAELKIFVTALPEVRAMRRYKELQQKGEESTFETVLSNLTERDRIDSTRAISPLAKADDARVLDNSELTIEEQNQLLLSWAEEVIARQKS